MYVFTDLSDYGWKRENEYLRIVWDSPENLQQVQRTVDYLTQGCKCKTGCTTRRCKCKKENIQCGPSCQCINCKNTYMYTTQSVENEEEIEEELEEYRRLDDEVNSEGPSDSESDEGERLLELNRDVDDIMEEVFGVPF